MKLLAKPAIASKRRKLLIVFTGDSMFDGPLGLVKYFGAIISCVICFAWVLGPLLGASDTVETRAYFMYVTGRRSSLDRHEGKPNLQFAIIDDLLALAFVIIPSIIFAYLSGSFA